jgi:hypothetical protein
MKRLAWVVVGLVMIVGAGCEKLAVVSQQKAPEAYSVMIDGLTNVFDTRVVHNGEVIGEIQSTGTSPARITRLAVSIAPEYREKVTSHTVFVISAGQLTLKQLDHLGTPLPPGEALMGFASTESYYWFMTKTLFPIQPPRRCSRLLN